MKEEIINFIYDNLFKNKINEIADKYPNSGGASGGLPGEISKNEYNQLGYNSSKLLFKDNGKLNTFYASSNRKMTPSAGGFKIKPIDKRSITPSLQILFQ